MIQNNDCTAKKFNVITGQGYMYYGPYYKLDGKLVAKNRNKRCDQPEDSLCRVQEASSWSVNKLKSTRESDCSIPFARMLQLSAEIHGCIRKQVGGL